MHSLSKGCGPNSGADCVVMASLMKATVSVYDAKQREVGKRPIRDLLCGSKISLHSRSVLYIDSSKGVAVVL